MVNMPSNHKKFHNFENPFLASTGITRLKNSFLILSLFIYVAFTCTAVN